jgi:nucleotide-binding universal stress UspA family protein
MGLLVGYDGSAGAEDALELGRVLASVEDAEMVGVEVTADGGAAKPAKEAIVEVAEADDVATIVLGSPHRGPVGRVLLGSVAERVLHGAPRETAVAPHGYADAGHGPFATIAAAFDGTPEAKAALDRGRRLAEASRAKLRVLTVVTPPVALPGAVGSAPGNPPDPEKTIEEGVAAAGTAIPVESRRLDGTPAAALAEACEDDVDLLVVGSRGYGPAMRVLLGSVSTRLVNSAPCPVLVVPRPAATEAAAGSEDESMAATR